MATQAGDSFTGLLKADDDLTPEYQPPVTPLSDTTPDAPDPTFIPRQPRPLDRLNKLKDQQEAQFEGEQATRLMGQRRAAHDFQAQYNKREQAQELADGQLMAQYGTSDPLTVAKVKALGVFEPDANKQMQLDPEGFRDRIERAKMLIGKGPPMPGHALGMSGGGEAFGTPSGGTLSQVSHTPTRAEQIARTLFEGKLQGAETLAATPTPKEEKAGALVEKQAHDVAQRDYVQNLLATARSQDGQTAQNQLDSDMRDKKFAHIDTRTFNHAQSLLGKYGKTQQELQMNPDKYPAPKFFPLRRGKGGIKPGTGADNTEPATVFNPGSTMPSPMEVAKSKQADALSQPDEGTSDEPWAEMPRTFDYARGAGKPPAPKRASDYIKRLFYGTPPAGDGEAQTE